MDSEDKTEAKPLDPVALTLAIWLGFVAGVTGLTHLQQEASAQAALDEAAGKPPFSVKLDDAQVFAARAMPFGG